MTDLLKTVTLGCKVNQYETQLVREGLLGIGYRDAERQQTANLCIVNTCTVTQEGDSKSRQVIRRLARENPESRIVVMGCYATRAPEELSALPNVSEVVTDKREIPDLLGRFGVIDIPSGISQFGDRHRAYVKVQDGCLLRCSYCVIPSVRPGLHSRPVDAILAEVDRLTDNGYREIVLTGIHLGHYGVEGNWNKPKSEWLRLSHLLEQIAKLDGNFRIRLSSIEATEMTRELIQVMATYRERICPHLHICLQSGSDRVLRKMKRRWSTRTFQQRCELIHDALDQPALTTDIIVGFPGETDSDFEASCQLVREIGFSKIHVFPFSPRRGTPAAEFVDQIPKRIKTDRRRELTRIEAELRKDYFLSLRGRPLQVLTESRDSVTGIWTGTSCRYTPTELPKSASIRAGQLVEAQALHANSERVYTGPPPIPARPVVAC
ncbi:MAG: tRNA (N(6)-L-threonylcarbamoyladenosine(37)-C(2))-methylthiotransferase MtaB [Planctomycetota bacterium]|nr:tRNA (N(6)-L-threonylcarbamoyladenosine(37)-C(2))-methylthiotransferase MtaB [Planctomycetota bacterium]